MRYTYIYFFFILFHMYIILKQTTVYVDAEYHMLDTIIRRVRQCDASSEFHSLFVI
jgi:hypothetical protein